MLIYKDVFTGDELASDSFPFKIVDDLIFEFRGRHVAWKETGKVLNLSVDEDGGGDERVERGIDIVLSHRLVEMDCYEDSVVFKSYIKNYAKNVVEYLERAKRTQVEIDDFKKRLQRWVVGLSNKERFKNLQFFVGETMAEGRGEGQVCIIEHREEADGKVPYLMLIKEGVSVEND